MPSLDYNRLADVYDDYCTWTGDLEFFRRVVATAPTTVLELMAGTGRVTRAIVPLSRGLVAVDSSLAMLAVASRRLSDVGSTVALIAGDVRALPVAGTFERVLLPFQGFTELLTEDDRRACLGEVARVLAPDGRFVCTTHNPPVRLRSVDGRWHEVGTFKVGDSERLTIRLKARWDGEMVRGHQVVERRDLSGLLVDERRVELEFGLVPFDHLVRLGREQGLDLLDAAGDYDGSPFDPDTSPVIVATFGQRT